MKITLCYKEYDCKVSLASMKQFKEATGKDLWFTLLSAYNAFLDTSDKLETERQIAILNVVDFECGAELFSCVTLKDVTTQEIEDAMYHSGWRSNPETTSQNNPWTIELISLAVQYDAIMKKAHEAKKPKPVTEQTDGQS